MSSSVTVVVNESIITTTVHRLPSTITIIANTTNFSTTPATSSIVSSVRPRELQQLPHILNDDNNGSVGNPGGVSIPSNFWASTDENVSLETSVPVSADALWVLTETLLGWENASAANQNGTGNSSSGGAGGWQDHEVILSSVTAITLAVIILITIVGKC